ncbi:glutathione S-transferase [Nitrobacter sp.]|uniref:glutathione S-transferase family protein n=1 Tax=Nitrobacter sp. TaxID=29420 RepID=UPI0029CAC324|nr:glutathione S-transferase [Nitrobacter sp.]
MMTTPNSAAPPLAKHRLYYSPGTCALAPHIVLEEIGAPYELQLVSASGPRDGEMTSKSEWKAINPKARMPALLGVPGRIGGADNLLTEVPASLMYLARTNPAAKLLPSDPAAEARCIEWMNWLSSSLHTMAFAQMWRPHRFTADEGGFAAVRNRGRENVAESFAYIEKLLADGRTGGFRKHTRSSMPTSSSSTIGAAAASGWTWRSSARPGPD